MKFCDLRVSPGKIAKKLMFGPKNCLNLQLQQNIPNLSNLVALKWFFLRFYLGKLSLIISKPLFIDSMSKIR